MEVTENEIIAAIVATSSRLKREERSRTNHDSAFSQWKVLIGPSDWEDHSMGKEGAERYRTRNLPNCNSCTGVYELGIAFWHSQTGRDSSKLDRNFIIPVYVGQSDNVRNRMQQYGRDGSHLENGNSNGRFNDSSEVLAQTEPGLFRETFSKGFSIVYRWVPIENTWDARKTESDLLDKFDYAWNKDSNGERRCNDIVKKRESISNSSRFRAKQHLFPQNKKGIKIKVDKLPSLENGLDFYSNSETNGLFQQVFKIGRSQPRLIVRSDVDENNASICDVALGHGVVCKRPPTEGKQRCAEHGWMKANGFTSKLIIYGKPSLIVDEHSTNEDFTPGCGVILDDGSRCTSKPLQGNKRCLEHKGRMICNSTSVKIKDKKENYVYGHVSPSKDVKHSIEDGDLSVICGIDLDDGTFCTRQPPTGRKRCEEHKGMRIKTTISRSFKEEIPIVFEGSRKDGQNGLFLPSVFCEERSPTCGAALQNGSYCSRKPSEGDKRCWQHKSTKTSPGSNSVSDSKGCDHSSRLSSYRSVYEHLSPTCGVALQNGSFCSRKPAEGNKICWQHYGMRVNSSPGSGYDSISCGYGSRYASNYSAYENFSSTCGAPCRNGSYCSRKVTGGGRCWQHGG